MADVVAKTYLKAKTTEDVDRLRRENESRRVVYETWNAVDEKWELLDEPSYRGVKGRAQARKDATAAITGREAVSSSVDVGVMKRMGRAAAEDE